MNILDLLKSIVSLDLGNYIRDTFGTGPGTEALIDVGGVLILSTFCLLIVIFLIWLERKVLARMQDRVGPNRVGGRYGLLQTVADVMKLLTKEIINPFGADWIAYNLAPILIVMAALADVGGHAFCAWCHRHRSQHRHFLFPGDQLCVGDDPVAGGLGFQQ